MSEIWAKIQALREIESPGEMRIEREREEKERTEQARSELQRSARLEAIEKEEADKRESDKNEQTALEFVVGTLKEIANRDRELGGTSASRLEVNNSYFRLHKKNNEAHRVTLSWWGQRSIAISIGSAANVDMPLSGFQENDLLRPLRVYGEDQASRFYIGRNDTPFAHDGAVLVPKGPDMFPSLGYNGLYYPKERGIGQTFEDWFAGALNHALRNPFINQPAPRKTF